jgi:hypothetical protein
MAITAGQAAVRYIDIVRQPELPLLRSLMKGRSQMRKISLFAVVRAMIVTGFGLWVFAIAAAVIATGTSVFH